MLNNHRVTEQLSEIEMVKTHLESYELVYPYPPYRLDVYDNQPSRFVQPDIVIEVIRVEDENEPIVYYDDHIFVTYHNRDNSNERPLAHVVPTKIPTCEERLNLLLSYHHECASDKDYRTCPNCMATVERRLLNTYDIKHLPQLLEAARQLGYRMISDDIEISFPVDDPVLYDPELFLNPKAQVTSHNLD